MMVIMGKDKMRLSQPPPNPVTCHSYAGNHRHYIMILILPNCGTCMPQYIQVITLLNEQKCSPYYDHLLQRVRTFVYANSKRRPEYCQAKRFSSHMPSTGSKDCLLAACRSPHLLIDYVNRPQLRKW